MGVRSSPPRPLHCHNCFSCGQAWTQEGVAAISCSPDETLQLGADSSAQLQDRVAAHQVCQIEVKWSAAQAMTRPPFSLVYAGNAKLLLHYTTKLGISHSHCLAIHILLQELLETCRMNMCWLLPGWLRELVVVIRRQTDHERHRPLLILPSSKAVAAASASVVFSNLSKALSFTICACRGQPTCWILRQQAAED